MGQMVLGDAKMTTVILDRLTHLNRHQDEIAEVPANKSPRHLTSVTL
jgi:hypothetical protein